MRLRFLAAVLALAGTITFSWALQGQQAAAQAQNNSTKIPDLSGTWGRGQGGFGSSLSLADPQMKNRGHEPDIPYQDWARAKTLSEHTSTGPDAEFYNSTNPQMWCEPVGVPAVYGWPAHFKFVQTPDAVYMLYQYGVRFRIIRLNSKHPTDPDPQWWGDSIGWYENGDTLVVDTIGLNNKVWLDEAAHPQTEQMHMIERYKRVDKDTVRYLGDVAPLVFTGPNLITTDMSLRKTIAVREGKNITLSADMFNAFNRPNFSPPTSLTPFLSTLSAAGAPQLNGSFGTIALNNPYQTITTSRQFQLNARFVF